MACVYASWAECCVGAIRAAQAGGEEVRPGRIVVLDPANVPTKIKAIGLRPSGLCAQHVAQRVILNHDGFRNIHCSLGERQVIAIQPFQEPDLFVWCDEQVASYPCFVESTSSVGIPIAHLVPDPFELVRPNAPRHIAVEPIRTMVVSVKKAKVMINIGPAPHTVPWQYCIGIDGDPGFEGDQCSKDLVRTGG